MQASLTRSLLKVFRSGWMDALDRLDAIEKLPADDIARLSRERLDALLRHACAQVPHYRKWCDEAGVDPARVDGDDLPSMPLITKRDLMEDRDAFLAEDAADEVRVPWQTGGSSGTWFRFFIDRRTFDIRTANALRGAMWTGWRPGDRQAVLWGHISDNNLIHSWRGRLMASLVHRSLNLNVYDVDEAAIAEYARRLVAWRPALVRGYTRSLAFIADYLQREGLEIEPPRGVISTAETLFDHQREAIERGFGCRVFNRYGSREFADIAQQCEQVDGLHVFTDRVHLEILRPDGAPCEPGERGEIVITDLENRVMPFIRYRTGDLARTRPGGCACGRGFPLLEAVEGRTTELLIGKNGKLYPYPGPALFGLYTPGIAQMQLYQTTRDAIEVRVVPADAWEESIAPGLVELMKKLLGDIDVTVTLLDHIAPLPSGKTPFVVSEVAPDSSWENASG